MQLMLLLRGCSGWLHSHPYGHAHDGSAFASPHGVRVVVIHDVVNKYLASPGDGTALLSILSNVRLVLKAARSAAVPVVFIAPIQGHPPVERATSIRAAKGETGIAPLLMCLPN